MAVEFIPAEVTHDLTARLERVRSQALGEVAGRDPEAAGYWEDLFEANALALLTVLDRVQLSEGHVVRYCFYGRHRGDLLVRPFVARGTTDVSDVRRSIDWHAPPDSVAPASRNQPTRDVELLYRHFQFERSPLGYFEYWVAMQELWGSARWVHSRIIADRDELERVAAAPGWHLDQPVQRCEPAVVLEDSADTQLAVLLHCPLERESISLYRIRIDAEQAISVVETIPVAHGSRGYHLH